MGVSKGILGREEKQETANHGEMGKWDTRWQKHNAGGEEEGNGEQERATEQEISVIPQPDVHIRSIPETR